MKSKKLFLLLFLSISLSFTSCSNDENSVFVQENKGVFIVGVDPNDQTVPKVWNNDNVSTYSNVDNASNFQSIFVANNDIYVVGSVGKNDDQDAIIWKNGIPTNLTDSKTWSSAHSVFVAGNDVYVAGRQAIVVDQYNSYGRAIYWKNGIATNLNLNSEFRYSRASSIFVSGNDVYAVGNASSSSTKPVFWKNGIGTELPNNVIYYGTAKSIFVSGTDVYIAGEIDDRAIIWKNGIAYNLYIDNIPSDNSSANSIFVSGNDVYVAGYYSDGTKHVATIWKNGIGTRLSTYYSEANSVYVVNNDVYVAGYRGSAVLWKNGIEKFLTEGQGMDAVSVFVKF